MRIDPGGGDGIVEMAQADAFVQVANARVPTARVRVDTFVRVATVGLPIPLVLIASDDTQVIAGVVEAVAVDVIDELAGTGVHDDAVQQRIILWLAGLLMKIVNVLRGRC